MQIFYEAEFGLNFTYGLPLTYPHESLNPWQGLGFVWVSENPDLYQDPWKSCQIPNPELIKFPNFPLDRIFQ